MIIRQITKLRRSKNVEPCDSLLCRQHSARLSAMPGILYYKVLRKGIMITSSVTVCFRERLSRLEGVLIAGVNFAGA